MFGEATTFWASIRNPDMEEYFDKGCEDFINKIDKSKCPYEEGTPKASQWHLGWNHMYNLEN